MNNYKFKIANKKWELEEIHKLNYETFVKEIPQHSENSKKELIDKFHDQNTYLICISKKELLGMIAVRDKRPFSLDHKLDNLDSYLPESNSICEIRLLSIRKEQRNRRIIKGLFVSLAEFCESNDYDLAIISATTNQERLYKTLGFESFGPQVGKNGATFQPMYLTPRAYYKFKDKSKLLNELKEKKYLFMPGPVAIKEEIREEFYKELVSHRSEKFVRDFNITRKILTDFTLARNVQIVLGSGTLANDIVAAQLSQIDEKGLILSNGEFGNRLKDHAFRFNLDFHFVEKDWGDTFSLKEIENICKDSSIHWIWFVHCETSTGVLNDLQGLQKFCENKKIKLCVDCISSIGTVSLNLSDVYLATGASGKGIGSYPGLSFVFYNIDLLPKPGLIPRYFDLGYYELSKGIPFTISSNLLYSLKKSLELFNVDEIYKETNNYIKWLYSELDNLDLKVISKKSFNSPALITFKLPETLSSVSIGENMESKGFYLSYKSKYLVKRNLMQIALMGDFSKEALKKLPGLLKDELG